MSLKNKYWDVLVGFEKYSFSDEQINLNQSCFETALSDLKACEACDGSLCKTSINHRCSNPYCHVTKGNPCTDECYPQELRGYYALWHKGCRDYKRAVFAVFACPGVECRKEQLLERLVAKQGVL